MKALKVNDQAWEYFITQFRPVFYAAARATTRDELVGLIRFRGQV